jgi:hypothetical protein
MSTQAAVTVSGPADGWVARVEKFWSTMTWLLSVGLGGFALRSVRQGRTLLQAMVRVR